jgi:hypothetical protein
VAVIIYPNAIIDPWAMAVKVVSRFRKDANRDTD